MKTFLAVVGYIGLTLLAAVSGIWIVREPMSVKACAAVKRNFSPDECIKTVAVYLSKPELCERVTGTDFKFENPPKQECYTEIAARTNDVSLCAKVEGGLVSETKFTCLYRVATRNQNAAACTALPGAESRFGIEQNKETCFKAIGRTETDAAAAPPTRGRTPIVLGLGTDKLDLMAYSLLGLWALWTVVGIGKKFADKKGADQKAGQ